MYSAVTPKMSQVTAAELGRYLGKYAITVSGLEVWQIGESGKRYRDSPLADTVTAAIGSAGGSMASAGMGAAAAPVVAPIAAPILALIGPAAIVAAMTAAIAMLPVALASIYHTRKHDGEPMAAVAAGDPIVATELSFDLADVSAKRRRWSEYLIGVYAARHQWTDVRGFEYAGQLEAGARAAGEPIPWGERRGQYQRQAASASAKPGAAQRLKRELW